MFKVQDNSSSNVEVVNLFKQCVADLSISLKTWKQWCGSHCTPQMFKCLGMVYSHQLDQISSQLCCSEEEWCLVLGLDTLCFWIHGCQSISPNWAPHWAPKTVTSISLYQSVFLNTLQLAAGATGLSSQGVTTVVHGCSVHTLGPRVNLTHSWRGGKWCYLWLSH